MSTLVVATLKSNSSSPPAFQNTSGTEVGTLCRAWVNFNGTGTVAIRAQFNVSSITDNGTGDYTVNFTNALADANYCALATGGHTDFLNWLGQGPAGSPTTGSWRVYGGTLASKSDLAFMYVAVFR